MGNLILNLQCLAGFDTGRFSQDLYMSLGQHSYDAFVMKNRREYIVSDLGNTLLITLFAAMIGIVLGTLVALICVTHNNDKKKSRFLNATCSIYLTAIRGTPVVVQLLITYYAIYQFADKMVVAVITFGTNSGAHMTGVIRGGTQSVDKGQVEAGRFLGLNQKTTIIKVAFPQALKNVAPAIFNKFISLLKETSIVGYIGVQGLIRADDTTRSITYDAYTPLLTVIAVYLLIVVILTRFLTVLGRRLSAGDIR